MPGNTVYNPLDGILFHHKACPLFFNSPIPICTPGKWVKKAITVRLYLSVLTKNTTQHPHPGLESGARTLTTTPPHLLLYHDKSQLTTFSLKFINTKSRAPLARNSKLISNMKVVIETNVLHPLDHCLFANRHRHKHRQRPRQFILLGTTHLVVKGNGASHIYSL